MRMQLRNSIRRVGFFNYSANTNRAKCLSYLPTELALPITQHSNLSRPRRRQMSASRALQPAIQDNGSQLQQQQQQQGGLAATRYEASPTNCGGNSQHEQQQLTLTSSKAAEHGRLRNIRQAASSKLASQSVSSSPVHSLISARSNTPISRPSSSLGFNTPTPGNQSTIMSGSSNPHRTASACSNATIASGRLSEQSCDTSTSTTTTTGTTLGQCRICRKFIATNESCHLCSNCNQFICEDCASYSANEQVSSPSTLNAINRLAEASSVPLFSSAYQDF